MRNISERKLKSAIGNILLYCNDCLKPINLPEDVNRDRVMLASYVWIGDVKLNAR